MDFSDAMLKLQRLFNKEAYAELRTAIFSKLQEKDAEIARLNKRISDLSWQINPDRMGGQFTQEEINRTKEWY